VSRLRTHVALLATLLLLVSACGSSGAPVARTGEVAPPITGTGLDGEPVNLADLRGRPVIVNFWASWCTPCRDEFPLFAERLATLGPADGLVILGVLYKDRPELAQSFLDDFGASWPSIDDPEGDVAAAYRVVAPPQTYFIDAEGILRGIQIGEVRAADFDTQYAKIKP
jgi:cytochrome c biogenesis protein CcmG, thiol:disulfide interchange protein DsbE